MNAPRSPSPASGVLDVLGNGVQPLVLHDPEGCPGVVDQELIEYFVEWSVGLHASPRVSGFAQATIARAGRR